MDVSNVLPEACKTIAAEGLKRTPKFTGAQPFGESLQATPNLRIDHLRM